MIQKEPFYSVKTKLKVLLSNLFQSYFTSDIVSLAFIGPVFTYTRFKIPSQYSFTIDLYRLFSQQSGFRF